ncbi:hypothetical protein RCL_jg13579.t1 [Rhizophagus clarus]|uniref:Uncharacterized protein n=1 Tax=Rhizophagus clarus TaxID=94130 RepID=A0A8H3LKW4_9GLOM|nr:hypothetical protein RCL_jg13579.t1 [Rhizophagus clarus]
MGKKCFQHGYVQRHFVDKFSSSSSQKQSKLVAVLKNAVSLISVERQAAITNNHNDSRTTQLAILLQSFSFSEDE